MKRFVLAIIVIGALLWIGYSGYQLWINNSNSLNPQTVFSKKDKSILRINRFDETKSTHYFELLDSNSLASVLTSIDSINLANSVIYASGNRPLLLIEKALVWNDEAIAAIKSKTNNENIHFIAHGHRLLITKGKFKKEDNSLPKSLIMEADIKASANYWVAENKQWKRTDIYNLSKGFYEYRSSDPTNTYGQPVKDIPLFSSVIPASINFYHFQERFYAAEHDSIFKNSPMNLWVDKGFVTFKYKGKTILVCDYRPQQLPSLILNEKVKDESTIKVMEGMYSYKGIQLTRDFPSEKNKRFYVFAIENRTFLCESEDIAREIQVAYQLGRTLALNVDRKNHFFSGLPSYVNQRIVSSESKSSLTYKDKLLFEVNTRPPEEQLLVEEKDIWSTSPSLDVKGIIPIYDHLRNGISILSYDALGNYELIGPNGESIWNGKLNGSIKGKVKIVDAFSNDKHQFLIHTKNSIYLIDLNGNSVGAFPYHSTIPLTSEIDIFSWNGQKRFLVGNEKGEVVMISTSGKVMKAIQVGNNAIKTTPYALNIHGNLRAWAINNEKQAYIGYLETNAEAVRVPSIPTEHIIKYKGVLLSYFSKGNKLYLERFNPTENKKEKPIFVGEGKIYNLSNTTITIQKGAKFTVLDHKQNSLLVATLPFNEVGYFNYLAESKTYIALNYLSNKIFAFHTDEIINGYPKEGRSFTLSVFDNHNETTYTYTIINQSIICYKEN